jgi:hypothetical protein
MTKIKVWDNLKREINRGKQGFNKGLTMGFERLDNHISNIQQGRYTTVSGATGTGKTAFVDSAFVFHPYDYIQTNGSFYELEIVYYSLEIEPVVKLAKFVARKIWEDHGMLTNVNEIYSRGKLKIPPKIADIIDSYEEYFAILQEKTLFFRSSMSPNYLYKDMMGYAESRGKFIKDKNGIIQEYIPNNPNLITLIVVDHIGLIDRNKEDKTKKEAIDRASKILVFFRNICKYSPVVVSQFNRGIEGMDRKENNSQEPQLSDLKDSGSTQEDANTVIALFHPFKYGMEKHRGYPIIKLQRNYRSAHILKNRDGMADLVVGLHFIGEVGKFKELPPASELTENSALLNKIINYGKRIT